MKSNQCSAKRPWSGIVVIVLSRSRVALRLSDLISGLNYLHASGIFKKRSRLDHITNRYKQPLFVKY